MSLLAIIVGTFVSEDLTCIAVGLLIRGGELHAAVGLTGCYLGIVAGDFGLWLLGRWIGGTVLQWPRIRRRLPVHRMEALGDWFDRQGWLAVAAARFLPGTRFPVYLAAGAIGPRAYRFLLWAILAAAVWTPLLVGIVALVGEPLLRPLERFLGSGGLAVAAAALVLFSLFRLARASGTEAGRARLSAAVSRLWRWEFWPRGVFYLPLVPWITYLALRHRGLTTLTASNPVMPHGGIVGESKFEILRKLPAEWVVPTERINAGPAEDRTARFQSIVSERGWPFPLILKPDAGERGAGVKLARNPDEADQHLRRVPVPMLVQVYHPGPFEAGIFYYRFPEEAHGHILSITDKQFPSVIGDGRSTVEALIWRHPRYRMQAAKFLARLDGQADDVLGRGETKPLVLAGNHCQGAIFRDGGHLLSSGLKDCVDAIARSVEGFFFGRFDVRYADVEAFKAGRDFRIVEVNGALSESTNIYDPSWSLLQAYSVLYRQWRLAYEIGARNRARGHPPSRLRDLISDIRAYYRTRHVHELSD
jgi:membrane protein DedA with SNARE-associated domain